MIREGSKVKWPWGNGTAEGEVVETYTKTKTMTIDGNEITRHGEANDKALVIEQEDGGKVLKLESEVDRTS